MNSWKLENNFPKSNINRTMMTFHPITTSQEFDAIFRSENGLAAAKQICGRHDISFSSLKLAEHGEHAVFLVDDSFIIKIYAPFRGGFTREKRGLEFAVGKTTLKIPEIVAVGKFEGFDYLITRQLSGELMTRNAWLELPEIEQIEIVAQLAKGLKELHSHSADSIDFNWHEFIAYQSKAAIGRQIAANVNPEWIEKLPAFIKTNLRLLPQNFSQAFLHGDVHFGNLRLQKSNGKWEISGLFDFADSLKGFYEFDFVAIGLLMIQGQAKIQREFFKAYGYVENQLDESFRKRLMLMTILYECSDLKRYALRLKPEAVNFSFDTLEKAIWNFAE